MPRLPRPAMTFWSLRSIGASMTMWPWVCRKRASPPRRCRLLPRHKGSFASRCQRPSQQHPHRWPRQHRRCCFRPSPLPRFPTTPTALGRTPSGTAAPAPLLPASNTGPAPLAPASGPARFEPIEADEVAAFKRALADAAGRAPVAPAAAARPGVAVRSGPLLPPSHSTDFADTEMPGSDGQSTALSTTQYGELN